MGVGNYMIQRFASAFITDQANAPLTKRSGLTNNLVQIGVDGQINVYGYNFYNPGGSDSFIKFFEGTTGVPPVPGVAIPLMTFQVPTVGSAVIFGADILFTSTLGLFIYATASFGDLAIDAPVTVLLQQTIYKQ